MSTLELARESSTVLPDDGSAGARPTVLCVDDEPNVLSALKRLLRHAGYRTVCAPGGAEGLEIAARTTIDVVISDMRMPGMDGAEFLSRFRELVPGAPRILLTGQADIHKTIEAVNRGAIFQYLSKPWDDDALCAVVRQAVEKVTLERRRRELETLLHSNNQQLKSMNAELDDAVARRTTELQQAHEALAASNICLRENFVTSLKVFLKLAELRTPRLGGHGRRVADLSRRTANVLGLAGAELDEVFFGALLHDIGMIGLSDDLLAQPIGKARGEQVRRYRLHVSLGAQVLESISSLENAAAIVASHHEHFDGSGFPRAVQGLTIPVGARIVSIADHFDDLVSGESPSRALDREAALQTVRKGRGTKFDPQILDAFLAAVTRADAAVRDQPPRILLVSEILPGMTLARELRTSKGMMLLPVGHRIDERMIRQLANYETATNEPLLLHVTQEG